MITLVGQYDSPYVRRVAVSLLFQGVPFTHSPLSVFGDAAAVRKINPVGRVPALTLDDGEALGDSGAILDWLDERVGPERALLPAAGPERRRALRLVSLATGGMDKTVALSMETIIRPKALLWQEWADRLRLQLTSVLDALEEAAATASGTWLVGERIGHADIASTCLLGYLEIAFPSMLRAQQHPSLHALRTRCEAMEPFIATKPAAYVVPRGD